MTNQPLPPSAPSKATVPVTEVGPPAATLLPRRGHGGHNPGVRAQFSIPVLGGRSSAGTPTGALFLWAVGTTTDELVYELHRHEAVEILTVVLEGTMSHYDTTTERWAELHAGDVQMMLSGSGISHIEKSGAGTRAFQIQFDPGHVAALARTPAYTDHPATAFTPRAAGAAQVTDIVGGDGPVRARTEGLLAQRVALPSSARADLPIGSDQIVVLHVITGAVTVNGTEAGVDDTLIVQGADRLTLLAGTDPAEIFVIIVPAHPSYQPRRVDLAAGQTWPGGPGAPTAGHRPVT